MPLIRSRELAVLAAIVVVFAISLGRTAGYAFVWDDVREIEQNPAFDAPLWDGLGTTQTERTDPDLTELATIKLAYDSYRPLLFTSYWIDIQLFGRSARALHLVNVLLGALAILLAHALARRWVPAHALVATAIFALHPAQIEAVAYISARGDLLAGLLAMLATLAACRALEPERRPAGWCALAALGFAASLFTKEAYLGLPLAIAAIAWSAQQLRRRWWVPASLAVVSIGYFVVRAMIVTATSGSAARQALVALPGIVLEYVRILVFPFDLSTERMIDPRYAIPGWLVAIAAVAIVVWRGQRARPVVSALAWMVVLLAPSAVAIASTGVVADRYSYLSVLGAAVALVAAGVALSTRLPKLRVPMIALAVLWGGLTQVVASRQVLVWTDNATLYANAAAMTPESSQAQYRLGFLDVAAQRWDDAIARFELAIELDPENTFAHNNLGVVFLRVHRPADAEAHLARAVELSPAHFRAWFNLGIARRQLGNPQGACAANARALAINPRYEAAMREQRARCPGR